VLTLTLALLAAAPSAPAVRPTAAAWGPYLLVADGTGAVRAWKKRDLTFDVAFTKRLNGDGLLAIAASGGGLWGFDGARAFAWDEAGGQWDAVKSKPPREPCTAFAVVDGAPVGTCGASVHRFTDGQSWEAPPYDDQLSGRGFGDSPRALASHGTQLAIGTGFGEWGGYLWLLDVATGKWSKYYDELGNAVGIAWTPKGWAVAWSMSHILASTRTRLHGPDAVPTKEGKTLEGRYLRALAFDEGTSTLFGLEQQQLVRISDALKLEPLQSIGAVKYGFEPLAVGVSSGVAAFLALGGGRFLVVPEDGAPRVVGGKKVTVLEARGAPDAGPPGGTPR
jgi:hypothetical protein